MRNLIAIEWMKLRRLVTMKVILILYAITIPIIYYSISYLRLGPLSAPATMWEFPECYSYVAFVASWFNIMVGVVIMVFSSNEIKYRTQRQNVIDGLSKRDTILAKFYIVFLFSLAITLYTFLVAFITGLINGGSDIFAGVEVMAIYFVSTLGYFSFAFLLANLIRLPALAIILFIFSRVIEFFIGLVASEKIYQFFPLTTFGNLVPFPMSLSSEPIPDFYMLGQWERVLLALVYIGLFVSVSYWVIKRRDI